MKSGFSTAVLLLVAIAGVIPFVLMMVWGYDDGNWQSVLDAYLLKPYSPLVYAVLFSVGALIAYQNRNTLWAICLIPALLAALWPLYRADRYVLPVPKGAVVAFYLKSTHKDAGAEGCPPHWKYYGDLAGRFPLGVGTGDNLTPRALTDVPAGSEEIKLKDTHLPSHRHSTAKDEHGEGDRLTGNNTKGNDEGFGHPKAWTSYAGDGNPYPYMPPFRVMLFCEYTGETDQTTDATESSEAASSE